MICCFPASCLLVPWAMLAATAGVQNCVELLGLQSPWGSLAKGEPLVVQEVMHPPVRRMPCDAVCVAGERCAEPAFRVAASFMPFAGAAASALGCSVVMPVNKTGQFAFLQMPGHCGTLRWCCFLHLLKARCCLTTVSRQFHCETLESFQEAGHVTSLCWMHSMLPMLGAHST